MSAPPAVREMKLREALAQLLAAAARAEVVMRSGNCPKCGAEPVTDDGEFDQNFALSMCGTSEWEDIQEAVVEAEAALADVDLDAYRPGPVSIRECSAALVQLDLAMSAGVRR